MHAQSLAAILIFTSIIIGGLRLALVNVAPPIEFTFFNVFKDVAHLHFGVLFGVICTSFVFKAPIEWSTGDRYYYRYASVPAVILLVIECACAAVTLLSK